MALAGKEIRIPVEEDLLQDVVLEVEGRRIVGDLNHQCCHHDSRDSW